MYLKIKELRQLINIIFNNNYECKKIRQVILKDDYFYMKPVKLGSMHKGKTIYSICQNCCNLGFFAVYRRVMEAIYLAVTCGYYPVVELSEDFLYRESSPVNGHENPYEYYFTQPAGISVKAAQKGSSVIKQNPYHNYMTELVLTGKYGLYDYTDQYIYVMADVVKNYMKLNQETQTYIDDQIRVLLQGKKTIGLHVRGSDYKGNYNIHPIRVTEDEYINAITDIFKTGEWEQVFLATDDEMSLRKIKQAFGQRVVYYHDVKRSNSKKSVAFSKDTRKNHNYMLGLEVLRDAYTLSYCSGLVAGVSQVSICTQIIKMSRDETFEYVNIIHNGFNHNGRYFKG